MKLPDSAAQLSAASDNSQANSSDDGDMNRAIQLFAGYLQPQQWLSPASMAWVCTPILLVT